MNKLTYLACLFIILLAQKIKKLRINHDKYRYFFSALTGKK